jgi:hypothetical protein
MRRRPAVLPFLFPCLLATTAPAVRLWAAQIVRARAATVGQAGGRLAAYFCNAAIMASAW